MRLRKAVEGLSTVFGYASAIAILIAMLVISYGTARRYLVGSSTVWQTELSIYLLMFAAFGAAAYGLKHGDHVKIDIVVDLLPAPVRRVVQIVAAVLGFALAAAVAVMGFDTWWETATSGERSGTAWNPSLTIPHLIVPVGMTLLAMQYLTLVILPRDEEGER